MEGDTHSVGTLTVQTWCAEAENSEDYSMLSLRTPVNGKEMLYACAGVGGGGGTPLVHGRGRMTIDPRIPTMPGQSTSGFHQPGRHCLHLARNAVRCSASRMKGELHPSKNRS